MITGTIKDYTITTLQNILGMLVIKNGTQTNEIKILNRGTINTHKLDNLDIHTSNSIFFTNHLFSFLYGIVNHTLKIKRK